MGEFGESTVANIPALGQALSVASLPVVIASDQSAVPISGTVTATISGVATSSNQTNGSQKTQLVDSSDANMGTTGNPVQVALPATTVSTLTPLSAVQANAGTNLNTSALALESGGNLAAIKADTDNIPSKGQSTMAGSTPVTIASNQTAVPVSGSVTASGTVTANQGTAAAVGAPWPVYGTDDAGHALTVNSTTTAGKYAQDANLLGTLGTAFTTPGKVDVQGTATVSQGTAANLQAMVTPYASAVFAVQDNQGTRQAVTFTSGTTADTANTVALVSPNAANVMVTLHYSGSVTGGQMLFEVSDDNSNWYGITMAPASSSTDPADSYTLSSAAGNLTWQMFVGAYQYFRVRMHVQVVGAGSAIVAITSSALPSEPAVALAGGTAKVTQGTAANLNATVVNGGTFAVQNAPVAPTVIYNDLTNVTTAGTRVALAGSTPVQSVTVKARSTNTGLIYVGNSTVAAANGFQLSAGDMVSMDIANLATVYLDSAVNGEGVTYVAVA